MKDVQRLVVGFAFSDDVTGVLLMTKNRPDWQKGLLNGIGGKIEDGETPAYAMSREAREEAGLELEWIHKGVMRGTNDDGSQFECHIFFTYDDAVYDFTQMEDEHLAIYHVNYIPDNIVPNLEFLIPYGTYCSRNEEEENICSMMIMEYNN